MNGASSVDEAGHSKPVLWDNAEGWGGEGSGRADSGLADTCTPMVDSCWCMAKPPWYCILQLK